MRPDVVSRRGKVSPDAGLRASREEAEGQWGNAAKTASTKASRRARFSGDARCTLDGALKVDENGRV
jgi:hypothetical protein